MKHSQSNFTLKYFKLLIKILLFSFLSSYTLANDDKIGTVTDINGTIVAINDELEERDLLIHDPFFLNEEIFVTEGSSATIKFNDNTTVIMKELTSINVSEFENSKKNPKLKAELVKGKIIIESGSIAKKDNGEMIVGVTTSSLGLRGTRVDIDLKPSGKSNISLAKDSFGNVGAIEVNTDGQTSNITSTEQVLEISENNETTSREKTEDEKEEAKTVGETLIKSSKIDEEEITNQLQKKLEDGNLQDANNDGVVDESDVEITKEQITNEKKQNIDFIVENSKDENTEFLSDVINQSDEKSTGEVIEKIIETKNTLVEGVVGNLSDKDNEFITTSTSEGASLIKEKIFETIVAKETDKSAEVLSKVMAKSDEATINSVINNITEKNTNEESKLSLKVIADFSEKAPEKLQTLSETNKDQIDKLAVSAVEKASTSNEDANLIAKVVSVANDQLANKVVEEVSKNNTAEKQNLSAKVLKAIVETQPNKIEIINEELKEVVIKQTVDAVKTQQETETNIALENDLTDAVATIIVNTDSDTASKLIEEVSNIETETNLSLKVIAGISEKDGDKFTELSETNKEQVEKLTISAIQKAKNTSEDSQLIANVVAVASDELANKVVEEVSKTAVDEKQSFSVKVLKAIVDTEPEKIEIINEEIKEDLIEKAIEATKNQQEGNLIEEEDLTDAVTEIIVKTDKTTAAKVIDEINQIDTESNLSLEVISGISEKDTGKLNELSNNNKEQMDELTINAVQKAENTSEDSQLIANVVAVVNDDLVNKVVEEVSKTSTEEKQTLSAKVLKAIVDTEPNKLDIINDDVKDIMIKQTIESAQNQQEGIGIQASEDMTSIVSDIIVNSNTETGSKMIEELNNSSTDTDSGLSLQVISAISEKDTTKLNTLSENNKEQIEKLTETAIKNADASEESAKLIAKVVSVASDELVNKVVEEVSKNSIEENQALSAKVMKSIVDTNPEKIESLSDENKETIITQTIDAAKNQAEGTSTDKVDLSNTIAEIVTKSNTGTAAQVLETLAEVSNETKSKLSLNIVSNLSKQENYEEKLELLFVTTITAEQSINKLTEKAVEDVSNENDLKVVTNIVEKSNGTIADKIINSANSSKNNNDKIKKVIVDIIEKNPEKAVKIIENNEKTNVVLETIKNKIEKGEAVSTKDFEKVFDTNVTPN